MRLHDLKPVHGAKKRRKRVGRGPGSGKGKTSGRGVKGQGSRSGSSTRPGFEGGQLPLMRRLPKRGFNNKRFATIYLPVNLDRLNRFDEGSTVDEKILRESGLATGRADGVKILGQGRLEKKLTVRAHAFSAVAREQIEKMGGACEVIEKSKEKSRVNSG